MGDGSEYDDDFDNEYDVDAQYTKDDLTDNMFGAADDDIDAPKKDWLKESKPQENKSPYLVLARKYRPQNFADLVGQEAMVKTLTNAFKQNRIAHAFMLTGVRGIGKTTTARLIARALNYQAPGINTPSMELEIAGINCDAITQGRHPDVMELDAASRSGVDNMRELLDNVRYGPTQARYKIYIIDEVHMLSTAAFNALLKTLEEPPPHTKFIFATTETHKVPVTILSRCQRFDLRRLDKNTMANHLDNICKKENVRIEREGLEFIARAADGSVRDALSLLDQAIVQQSDGGIVSSEAVRDMLGLSDRGRIYNLFDRLLAGDAKAAIIEARDQYDYGATPNNILQSLMEICHETSKFIVLGEDYKNLETADNIERLKTLAARTTPLMASKLWQMMLTGFEEIKRAPDAMQSLEMCLIRLSGAINMPSPEDLARIVKEGGINTAQGKLSAADSGGIKAQIANEYSFISYQDMLKHLEEAAGERALVSQLERYARPVRLEDGLFAFEPTKDAPRNLHLKLSQALKILTGRDWRVYIEENGGQTIEEKRKIENDALMVKILDDARIKNVLKLFPGAKITSVRNKRPEIELKNIEGNRK